MSRSCRQLYFWPVEESSGELRVKSGEKKRKSPRLSTRHSPLSTALRLGPEPSTHATYYAQFLGAVEINTRWGLALLWRFRLLAGEHFGRQVNRVTDRRPTSRNSCGRMLAGIVRRQLRPDESVDLADYAGQCYTIALCAAETGVRVNCIIN